MVSRPRSPSAREDAVRTGEIVATRRILGSSELSVFPLALSGTAFGWTADDTRTAAVLDAYESLGGNFIDTADSYASGRSEIMIGNWMRARRNRDAIVVATKVGKGPDFPGVTADAIRRAVDGSLCRLGTDRIDLLYLHVDDPSIEFEETLLAVDELIGSGKVRYFGGADHRADRLIQARIASAQLGISPMVALQNQYHLMHRDEYERGLAAVVESQELAFMPRFALASGFLSGKYRTKSDLAGSRRAREIEPYLNRHGLRVLSALDGIAAERETAPASVALAWLLSKPRVVSPVVSASRPEQVPQLMAALEVPLARSEVAALDRVSS